MRNTAIKWLLVRLNCKIRDLVGNKWPTLRVFKRLKNWGENVGEGVGMGV
jgi:hypothetical protein